MQPLNSRDKDIRKEWLSLKALDSKIVLANRGRRA